MRLTKLAKSWPGQQTQNVSYVPPPQPQRAPPPQGGPYAPPPGPPPQWPQWQTPHSSPPQMSSRPSGSQRGHSNAGPTSGSAPRARIASKEEETRRLFKACETGKGNASLLREAVVYAKPEDLKGDDLIDEFRAKCRVSQELICSTIPWASAEVDRSKSSSRGGESPEERLLAELLVTNQELLDALQLYDDTARSIAEQQERDRKRAESKLRALDAITSFQPTPAESTLVDKIFVVGDPAGAGTIDPHAARKLFTGAALPTEILDSIWDIANVEENTVFGRHCVGVALRLVGHAQKGKSVTPDLVNEAGPLASIDGLDGVRREPRYNAPQAGPSSSPYNGTSSYIPSSPIGMPSAGVSPSVLPPLTAQDRAKFVRIFNQSGPEDNVLSGQRARDVLLRSKLPLEVLAQIWELADTQHRGALNVSAFCIAMYLVQACMSGQITTIPPSLPPFLYAEAAQAGSSLGSSSPQPASRPAMPDARSSLMYAQAEWAVPPEVRATADAFFEVLDEERTGYLDGKTARSHFEQTGLPPASLNRIWDLANMNGEGRLTREEFAVAVYLIQGCEQGQELPRALPTDLIPPSMRPAREPVTSQAPRFPVPSTPSEPSLIDFDAPEEPVAMPVPSIRIPPASPQTTPPIPSPLTPSSSSIWRSATISAPALPPRPGTNSMPARPAQAQPFDFNVAMADADRASAEKFFDQLDPFKQGYLEPDNAKAFLQKSKLDPDELAYIWRLADRDHDGRLDKDEFAVMMYLVRGRLAGKALPQSIPLPFFALRRTSSDQNGSEADTSAGRSEGEGASMPTAQVEAAPVEEQRSGDEPPPPYQEIIPEDTGA